MTSPELISVAKIQRLIATALSANYPGVETSPRGKSTDFEVEVYHVNGVSVTVRISLLMEGPRP